ncbi:MAG: Ig-like domain repeat protein, partial [Candidatus Acidiferrales bacterium]
MGPDDYAKIYNIAPLYTAGTTGSGKTIAVLGVTDIDPTDITDFETTFDLPGGNWTVVHNGVDPGITDQDDQTEATLDNEWSGATGRGAQIKFVVSKTTATFGTDLSAIYVEENNLADVMTVSYGACEMEFTKSQADAESAISEQAASQGITYMAASGDAGAEDCDDPNTETVATGPVSADMPGSSPFTVSVGGSEFNEGTGTYWSATNGTGLESALSYIPEDVWNESCTVAQCGASDANISVGGGAISVYFGLPTWQQGFNVPMNTNNAPGRGTPDVVLSAAGHDSYATCLMGSCESDEVVTVAGTSAGAPSFTGIMSLVDQATNSRQGQADYVLYKLFSTEKATLSECNASSQSGLPNSACIFNDVTIGDNAVPGETGYGNADADYQAATGWDAASGLGSMNVDNLVTKWNTVSFNSTTTTVTGVPTTATTGQSITAAITVTSGAGTPTGDVSVIATAAGCPSVGVPFVTLSGGAASSSFSLGGAGTYSIVAHYAGDGNFGASDSAPSSVTVTGTACSSTGGSGTFSAASSPTSASISSPGGSSSSTITVTGASFTGTVTLTCSVTPTKSTDSDIPSCSFNSPATSSVGLSLSPGSEAQTATLNVATTEASGTFIPSSPSSQHPMHTVWIAASIELALACLFLLTAPAQKKRWGLLFAVGVLA